MDIISLVADSLASLDAIVVYGWYDESLNDTHITYLEFDNLEDEFADDEATTEEHYIQLDIWTKDLDESQNLKKEIKKLMKENGFLYQDGQDQYENDTQLWHIASRWLYIENLE
ncbi:hypothetical protein [Clostridium yunnanense]|uniref:hypothetical protein n=1 Tax=Clostridium yunnanense TaxID=2800325 RepID=UPI0030843E48